MYKKLNLIGVENDVFQESNFKEFSKASIRKFPGTAFDCNFQEIFEFWRRNNKTSFSKYTGVNTVRKIYMARDGKYPHSTGKFADTMHVKDQIEYFDF